tara:strand:- start:1396 stop:1974 length:579 start_codon:yes stop_codon:yes gene_type:complete
MALGIISTALGLAELVPDIVDLFSGKDSKKQTDVARDVVDIGRSAVEAVTGKRIETPAEVENKIRESVEIRREFQRQYASQKHELRKKYLEDVQDARDMYESTKNPTTDRIANHVINFNLVYVLVAVAVQVGCMIFLKDFPNLLVLIGNIIGIIVGNLLQERAQILSFYFGSSLGSKMKDKIKSTFSSSVSK